MTLDFFETRGVIDLLFFLSTHPEGKQKIEMTNETTLSTNATLKSFNLLFEKGLLKQIKSRKNITKDLYTLSSYGLMVVNHLKEVESILEKVKKIQETDPKWFEFELTS